MDVHTYFQVFYHIFCTSYVVRLISFIRNIYERVYPKKQTKTHHKFDNERDNTVEVT